MTPRTPPMDRIAARSVYEDHGYSSLCCIYTGALIAGGYASIGVGKSRLYVHRVVYEHFNGPIPDGLQIDHLCRVRACCNPEHLEAVTVRENVLRGLRGRLMTHCVNGHAWTPENTGRNYLRHGRHGRRCRTCHREQVARAKRERKTA